MRKFRFATLRSVRQYWSKCCRSEIDFPARVCFHTSFVEDTFSHTVWQVILGEKTKRNVQDSSFTCEHCQRSKVSNHVSPTKLRLSHAKRRMSTLPVLYFLHVKHFVQIHKVLKKPITHEISSQRASHTSEKVVHLIVWCL